MSRLAKARDFTINAKHLNPKDREERKRLVDRDLKYLIVCIQNTNRDPEQRAFLNFLISERFIPKETPRDKLVPFNPFAKAAMYSGGYRPKPKVKMADKQKLELRRQIEKPEAIQTQGGLFENESKN